MERVKGKWIMGKASQKNNVNTDEFNLFYEEIKSTKILKNVREPVAKILYNRDINTIEKVKKHLFMELHETYNSTLLKDSDKFVEGLKKAIKENHKIVIIGDYDTDGVTSTAIAMLGLRRLGCNVDFYINNRFVEGYGFKSETLEAVLNKYPDTKTIITVDNGIVSFEAVELANEKGIQSLITDHHEPKADGSLPNAYAVVDHKRKDCNYPFKHLSGAGVIFKLLLLLYWELEEDIDFIYEMLDLLAVSTVADVVSLTDENRVFVREGLRLLRSNSRLFFEILNKEMEISIIDEDTIGFKYSPAINSIGRLDGCPSEIVEAMISDDEEFITNTCRKMVGKNKSRQEYTKEQTQKAEEILLSEKYTDALVVYDESFMEGIVGLIAGKLNERYYKPAIALASHNGILKGSARSTPLIDIKDALDYCEGVLEGYGGHPQAAGLSLKEENLEKFKKLLNEYVQMKMKDKDGEKYVHIDSKLEPTELNAETLDGINLLKPYGEGFKRPLFGYRTEVFDVRKTESDTLIVKGFNAKTVIGFNNKDYYFNHLGAPSKIAVVGCPTINIYQGTVSYQFQINENNIKGF